MVWRLALASLLVSSLPSQGATELQKFEATIPRGIRFRAIAGNLTLCATQAFIDLHSQDKAKLSFEEYKAKIEACDKPVSAYETEQLEEKFGMERGELNAARKRYRELFYAEEELKYYGKPIPGYVQDPWVTKLSGCFRVIKESKASYLTCTDKAVSEIAPFSADPSEVVASAVIGRCEPIKTQMVAALLLSCSYDNQQAASAVSNFTDSVRSQILGKVVSFRAELNKRRLLPAQPPKSPPKSSEQGI